MSKYLGLDRLGKLYQIVRQNGGLKNTYLKLYRQVSTLRSTSYIICINAIVKLDFFSIICLYF